MATIKDLLSNKTISRELCSQLDVADNHQCVTRLTQHYIELELIHHKDPKYFDKYYNSDGKTGNRFIDVLIRCKNRLTLKAFHDCAVEKERHDICDLLPDLPDILCDLLPEIPADQLLRNVRPSVLKDIGEKLTPTPGILVANWEEFAEHFKLKETQINEIKTSRVNTVTNSPAKELLECLSLESPKTLVSDIVSHFRKYYFNSIADFLQEHLDKGNIRKLPLICESESFACVSFHEVHGNSNSPGQKEEIHSNPQSDYRPNRDNQHATTFQEYLTPQDDIIQNQQKQLKKCNDQVLSSSNEISRNQTENHERSSASEGGMGNCAIQEAQSQQNYNVNNYNVGGILNVNEHQQFVPLSVIQYRGDGNSTNSDDGRSGDEFSDNEFDEEDSSNSCSQIQDGNSISSMEITTLCGENGGTSFGQQLFDAAEKGNLERTKDLLAMKPTISGKHGDGWTVIHAASAGGHAEVLKVLLEQDKSIINEPGHDNRTALYLACFNGQYDTVLILLACGADMTVKHKNGWSIYHAAAHQDHVDILRLLFKHNPSFVNDVTGDNRSPLYLAASTGNEKVVEYLLTINANPNIKQNDGFSAYHIAAQKGYLHVLKVLFSQDRSLLNDLTYYNRTMLHLCVEQGYIDVAHYLLQMNIDEYLQDKDGKTAEDLASTNDLKNLFYQRKKLSTGVYDVMLSYQWDSQLFVNKLKDFLQDNGLKVWMDIEQMHDNILCRMQEAVKTSKVIVFCMTKKYEMSDNCRLEYNYAFKRKKLIIPVKLEDFQPSNELDIIIGNKLYYTFFNEN